MNFRIAALAALGAMLAGCAQEGVVEQDGGAAAKPEAAPSQTRVAAPVGEAIAAWSVHGAMVLVEEQTGAAGVYAEPCVITDRSIAGISSPQTLGDFAGAFPAGSTLAFEPLYMVDLGSLCMIEGGAQKVCTYFLSYEIEAWDPEIEAEGLFTSHADCRTEDGYGPGSPVADVAAILGPPRFMYDYDNEGRENLDFAGNTGGLGFRASSLASEALVAGGEAGGVLWPNGAFGGDYRQVGSASETAIALPDAIIREVSIR